MQHRIYLLGTRLKTIFGSCEILSSSSAVSSLLFINSVGRMDDVVIHSSGEKTVPAPIEDVVMSST